MRRGATDAKVGEFRNSVDADQHVGALDIAVVYSILVAEHQSQQNSPAHDHLIEPAKFVLLEIILQVSMLSKLGNYVKCSNKIGRLPSKVKNSSYVDSMTKN